MDSITAETQKEEDVLLDKANGQEAKIEDRLLTAYKKLRSNAKNGLAVVTISRDSCSGCFNKIPPQRQADIRQRKKSSFANTVDVSLLMKDLLWKK